MPIECIVINYIDNSVENCGQSRYKDCKKACEQLENSLNFYIPEQEDIETTKSRVANILFLLREKQKLDSNVWHLMSREENCLNELFELYYNKIKELEENIVSKLNETLTKICKLSGGFIK